MTNTHTIIRDRSYGIRNHLADLLGFDRYYDFCTAVQVMLSDGDEMTLRTTSNAGFSGILGWGHVTDDEQGPQSRHISLGEIEAVEIDGTWITLENRK